MEQSVIAHSTFLRLYCCRCNPKRFLESNDYFSHVGKSVYVLQLRRWISLFGQDNVKVRVTAPRDCVRARVRVRMCCASVFSLGGDIYKERERVQIPTMCSLEVEREGGIDITTAAI